MNVIQALSNVMRDVGAVGKERENKAQGYKFRGIDDFIDAVHPALVANGVVMMPTVIAQEHDYAERTTSAGKASYTTHVWITVRFNFFGPEGDSVACTTIGEAADTADKAGNKAMSAALKYALIQGLMVPLSDMADGDSDSPDMGSMAPVVYTEPAAVTARRQLLLAEVQALTGDERDSMVAWCKEHRVQLTKPMTASQVDDADAALEAIVNGAEPA